MTNNDWLLFIGAIVVYVWGYIDGWCKGRRYRRRRDSLSEWERYDPDWPASVDVSTTRRERQGAGDSWW